jgi:galactose mutarotase-like enzyme
VTSGVDHSPDPDVHTLIGPQIHASIKAAGAELCALRGPSGRDDLWPAHPPWERHAPLLFPIVGRLRDDTLVHERKQYRLTQHGFARDRRFTWLERSATHCRLVLMDDDQTRRAYPFAFRFEVDYRLDGPAIEISFRITNTGTTELPASWGAHPAFRWPLRDDIPKNAHTLTFEADEPGPLRGVSGGLLTSEARLSPIRGRHLALSPNLFTDDALILEHPASRWVRFAAPGAGSITVSWSGFSQLGLWARPDADFLCIEPWQGMASPADFSGEFATKPWLQHIPPLQSAYSSYRIELGQ